jgi:hypothetical protein
MEKYEAIAILSAFVGEMKREDYKQALRMGVAALSKSQEIKCVRVPVEKRKPRYVSEDDI